MLGTIIAAIKDEQAKINESIVEFPWADPSGHLLRAGKCQGLKQALAIIDDVLNDRDRDNQES